jgi:hypothetical protein
MLKIIKTFCLLFSFVQFVSAQSFEGIVETRQVDANGVSNEISWYIKKDRIAFELKPNGDKAAMKMRFVPQPKQNSMLMVISTPEGESKSEVHANDISSEINTAGAELKDIGLRNTAEFGEVSVLLMTTATSITETEVSKMIDINLAAYASFFKNDYAVLALIKSGQSGFPLNSVTKDKNGKIISKTTIVSIRKFPVSESYFK